jgi:hypothetical protein
MAEDTTINDPTSKAAHDQAQKEIDLEISQATQPIQQEIGQLGTEKGRGVLDIGALFKGIQTSVDTSAQRVAGYADTTRTAEKEIYMDAAAQLRGLKEERSSEAQRLAQQLGAPIPLDLGTSGLDLERTLLPHEAGAGMLSSSMFGEANVAHAEAFAGRVFPLMRAREEAATRNFYDDKITKLQSDITNIKKNRGAMTNKRAREILLENRSWELEKTKAERDWFVAKKTLESDKERLRIERESLAIKRAEVTGMYKGKPTLARDVANQEKALRQQEIANAKEQHNLDADEFAFNVMDALLSGDSKSVTTTEWVPSNRSDPSAVPGKDIGKKEGTFWKLSPITRTVGTGAAMDNPNDIYNYLKSLPNMTPARARKMLKLRFPDWEVGKPWPPGTSTINPDTSNRASEGPGVGG